MKAVIFLIAAVLIIILIVSVVLYLINAERRASARPPARTEWKVEPKESESHPITSIYLDRGDRREYFGSVNRLDDDYEDKLYQMQAAAEDEAADRNAVDHTLRRGT